MANNLNPKKLTNWHKFSLLLILIAIPVIPLFVFETPSNSFSINATFKDDLNNGTISEMLKGEFKDEGHLISEKATVTGETDDGWVITSKEKTYIIKKEDEKLNIYPPSANRLKAWFSTLILLIAFVVIAGHGVTGRWLGLLIDERNRMSLSRLQMILWTVIILSGFFTAALSNIAIGAEDPLAITIPEELWILMGISTTSLVASPLILSNKKLKNPEKDEEDRSTETAAAEEGTDPEAIKDKHTNKGQLVANKDPKYARISNLFKGEETGNFAQLDLGKIQMLYFTLILVLAYTVALYHVLDGTREIDAFPALSESMVWLLGISHAGYLTNKAVPHSQTEVKRS